MVNHSNISSDGSFFEKVVKFLYFYNKFKLNKIIIGSNESLTLDMVENLDGIVSGV